MHLKFKSESCTEPQQMGLFCVQPQTLLPPAAKLLSYLPHPHHICLITIISSSSASHPPHPHHTRLICITPVLSPSDSSHPHHTRLISITPAASASHLSYHHQILLICITSASHPSHPRHTRLISITSASSASDGISVSDRGGGNVVGRWDLFRLLKKEP